MDQLESQVAKIQIDSGKNAASYVYVLAEKAPASSAELYAVVELPLFNPAAAGTCETICLAIAGALKRAYKKNLGGTIFETAVAQINEELSKLAETGNSTWVNKISCILAVKDGNDFSIATCGKIAAYLYRAGEFTDISCSADKNNPVKTFENLAFGKLRLEDVIILSTTQLFNYLSIDRLKNLLEKGDFLNGVREILETLKQNAGPEVAFGAILNLQVQPGQSQNEEINLEEYAATPAAVSTLSKIFSRLKLSKLPFPWSGFKKLFGQSKNVVSTAGSLIKTQAHNIAAEKIKNYSRTKKIFFISIIVLIFAFILDVGIAAYHKKNSQTQSQLAGQLQSVQSLLTQARASLLYKDTATAQTDVLQAQSQMPKASSVSKSDQALYTEVNNQLNTLKQSLENSVTPQVANLGSLGAGTTLLSLNNYLATQINSTILSYNLQSGAVEDSALLSSQKIVAAAYISAKGGPASGGKNSTTAVVYNGSALLTWDYAAKQFSQPFTASVPNQASFVNLKYYPTNSRVYTIDKGSSQIINFAVSTTGLSKPVVASKAGDDFSNTLDFAIDGNIYVLTPSGIDEYRSGSQVNFTMPTLFTPFSGKGKIYTEIGWKNLYVLDSGNNRILVIDKQGNLVETLQSSQFTNLKDFVVDEPNKVIYILNDSNLLKASLP